jgi:hypothetical protein
MSSPNTTWLRGPRVRVDTLKPGDLFLCMTGRIYQYVRRDDDALVHHVESIYGTVKTTFPGSAQVVVKEASP